MHPYFVQLKLKSRNSLKEGKEGKGGATALLSHISVTHLEVH